jgi:hypothetical protein
MSDHQSPLTAFSMAVRSGNPTLARAQTRDVRRAVAAVAWPACRPPPHLVHAGASASRATLTEAADAMGLDRHQADYSLKVAKEKMSALTREHLVAIALRVGAIGGPDPRKDWDYGNAAVGQSQALA